MNPSLALYIHIPFCAARCAYCDFNTYAGLEAFFEPYATALAQEIRQAGQARRRPTAHTIFVGGGTPTVLPGPLLAQVLGACRAAFELAPDAEITSEANPGTVDRARFAALAALGVNRLSIGVQSFDDSELRWLGRIHTADEAQAAFSVARSAGFANINLDLIFGLPGQSAETWTRTLDRAVSLAPEHLSLYSLTVEHGTPLADRVVRGLADEPDEDHAAELYELACERLAAGGYEQYEISNWAAGGREIADCGDPGVDNRSGIFHLQSSFHFQCRHNLVYWRREPYLGFGAGAHSFEREQRWWNAAAAPEYIGRIAAERSPHEGSEAIDRRTAMGEMMMLGLRLVQEGVADARFSQQFGVGLEEAFGAELRRLGAQGLLERLPDRVRLTPRGRLLGNRVFSAFLP